MCQNHACLNRWKCCTASPDGLNAGLLLSSTTLFCPSACILQIETEGIQGKSRKTRILMMVSWANVNSKVQKHIKGECMYLCACLCDQGKESWLHYFVVNSLQGPFVVWGWMKELHPILLGQSSPGHQVVLRGWVHHLVIWLLTFLDDSIYQGRTDG